MVHINFLIDNCSKKSRVTSGKCDLWDVPNIMAARAPARPRPRAPARPRARAEDTRTGALTALGPPVEQDGAGSFLAPSADGRFLYAIAKPGAWPGLLGSSALLRKKKDIDSYSVLF